MANVVQIVLTALDKTKQGFNAPIKNLNDLGAAVDKIKPAFLTLATAAAAAFGVMAKHAVNRADELGKLAQKAGDTVEAFSSLNYTSELSNIESEKLIKAYKELSKSLTEASDRGSATASMFRQMGIETRDSNGKMLTAEALMLNISDRFEETADGAFKVAAATKLFGDKLGQDMIPFLNQGSEEIRKLREEAVLFGQVVDGKTSKAANELNDNLTKMKLILQGIVNQVVAEFLPSAAQLTTEFIEWIKRTRAIDFAVGSLIDIFKTFNYVVRLVLTSFGALSDVFVGFANMLGQLGLTVVDFFALIGTAAGGGAAAIEEMLKGNFQNAEHIASESLAKIKQDSLNLLGGIPAIINAITDGIGNAYKTLSNGPVAPTFGEHEGPDGSINVQKAADEEEEIFQIHSKWRTMRELLDEAADEGHLTRFMALRDSEAAYEMQKLDERKQFIQAYADFYAEAHRGAFSYIAEAAKTVYAGIGNAITSIVMGTKTAAQAFKDLGMQMIAMVVNFMAQRAIAFAMEKIMAAVGVGMLKAATASATAAAVALAAAWAPAATAASIATFGAATAAGAAVPLMMASNAAAGSAIAAGAGLVGIAHSGLSSVPREGTWMLDGGERVVSPEQNQDLTAFLSGQGNGPTQVAIYLDGEMLGKGVGQLSRDGRLEISARAIVS
jgi:hypothetical protein